MKNKNIFELKMLSDCFELSGDETQKYAVYQQSDYHDFYLVGMEDMSILTYRYTKDFDLMKSDKDIRAALLHYSLGEFTNDDEVTPMDVLRHGKYVKLIDSF